eukprot:gene7995-1544_t
MVHAIPRVRGALAWIHPSTVRHLASLPCISARDRVLTSLAVLSYFHALRISEALRLAPAHFNLAASPPFVRVTLNKHHNNAVAVTEALHPQGLPWARQLCAAAPPGSVVPFCTLLPQDLNGWLRARLRGSRDADATWHGFRRGCATYTWFCGLSISTIQRVGPWQSVAVARILTGVLAWATCQHRFALPFLSAVHRWFPRFPRTPPPPVADAALLAALLSAVPWRGEGLLDLPLAGRPIMYSDGVASRDRAAAA